MDVNLSNEFSCQTFCAINESTLHGRHFIRMIRNFRLNDGGCGLLYWIRIRMEKLFTVGHRLDFECDLCDIVGYKESKQIPKQRRTRFYGQFTMTWTSIFIWIHSKWNARCHIFSPWLYHFDRRKVCQSGNRRRCESSISEFSCSLAVWFTVALFILHWSNHFRWKLNQIPRMRRTSSDMINQRTLLFLIGLSWTHRHHHPSPFELLQNYN